MVLVRVGRERGVDWSEGAELVGRWRGRATGATGVTTDRAGNSRPFELRPRSAPVATLTSPLLAPAARTLTAVRMHGLARSSRNAKTLNALCPRFNLARYYSVAPALKDAEENSSPARASEDASEGRVKPVKTRVLYSELPKARLTADGTPIPPLPAWDGGLEARTKPKQARGKPGTLFQEHLLWCCAESVLSTLLLGVSESLSHAQPPHENNSIALDSQKTTTLPATGNAADSLANRVPAVDNTEASADAPEPSEVKAKRRRRKKVAEPEEGSLEEGHVKEKPARRRKRATASLENMADEKSSKSKSTPKRKEAKLEG